MSASGEGNRTLVTSQSSGAKPSRVPLANILTFGAAGVPLTALSLVYSLYLPRFYVGLGLSFIAVSAALALVRLIDITLDPMVALFIDRTKTVIGRYRPWIIAGAPLTMLGVYRLLNPPHHVTPNYLTLWFVVGAIGTSMISVGLAAWSSVVSTNYNDRSRLYGWTEGMSTAGLVALFILPILTHGKIVAGRASAMPILCAILLIALAVGVFTTVVLTPERRRSIAARAHFGPADYWRALARPNLLFLVLVDFVLSTGFGITAPILLYFFHDVKGFTDADVSLMLTMRVCLGIIAPPLWATLARRVGKRVALQAACGAYAVAQTVVIVLPGVAHSHIFADLLPTMLAVTVAGCAASAHNLLLRAMAIDIVDEVKLTEKKDCAGLILSMVTTTTKIGGTVSVFIAFPILQLVGYSGKPGAVNTPSAIFGLEMCYVLVPIGLAALGGLLLFGYKLDRRRHAEIESALQQDDHLEPLSVPPMAPELATVDPVVEI